MTSPGASVVSDGQSLSWRVLPGVLLLILSLATVQPRAEAGPALAAAEPRGGGSAEAGMPETPRERRVQWTSPAGAFEVTSHGRVELTADERSVSRLDAEGSLKIENRRDGSLRVLEVKPSHGAPSFLYTVDGKPRPFDGEGQQWLAGCLSEVVSETGLGADVRVARLVRESGVQGVLDEVSRVTNPRVRTLFLLELMRQRSLGHEELRQVTAKAVSAVPEGYLPIFLARAADSYLDDAEARAIFLDATAHIPSDMARSRLILDLLQRPNLGSDAAVDLMRTAEAHFQTDNVRALFLGRIAEHALADAALRPVFMESFDSIRADMILVKVASELLNREENVDDKARLQLFQKAFDHLHVDTAKTILLIKLSDRFLADPTLKPAFLRAADTVREPASRSKLTSTLHL